MNGNEGTNEPGRPSPSTGAGAERASGAEGTMPDAAASHPAGSRMQPPGERHAASSSSDSETLAGEPEAETAASDEVSSQRRPDGFEALSEADRSALEASGITNEFYDELKELSQELIRTGSLPDDKRSRLGKMVDSLQGAPDDIQNKVRNMLSKEHLALTEQLNEQNPDAALGTDEEPVSPEVVQDLREVQDAVNKVLAGETLDIDEAQQAAEKLQKARERIDKHEAEHIGRGPSKAYRLAVTLGVLFYLYVGAQYAMANAFASIKS